jgi:hypothetical protein
MSFDLLRRRNRGRHAIRSLAIVGPASNDHAYREQIFAHLFDPDRTRFSSAPCRLPSPSDPANTDRSIQVRQSTITCLGNVRRLNRARR